MEIKDGAMTTTLPDSTPVFTHEEWLAEGKRRFGEKFDDWKFQCPICGNVAAVGDFRKYKHQGATPDSATQECIGRYQPKEQTRAAFGETDRSRPRRSKRIVDNAVIIPVKKPCDYAVYGLFRIPGVIVTGEDGKKMLAFAFAETEL